MNRFFLVGREGLVLRHSAYHFLPNSGDILSGVSQRRASAPHLDTKWRNENINYFISSSGNRIYNLSRLQSHASTPSPRLASKDILVIIFI